MKKEDLTPKQAEIKAIEDLFALDGYFADAFDNTTVDKMLSNIHNDFTLLCGTELESRIYDAEKRADELVELSTGLSLSLQTRETTIETLEKENYDLKNKVLNVLDAMIRYDGVIDLNEYYSRSEIISAKLRLGVTLNTEEVAYILPRLDY